jgi:CRP/FNR family transcriptional regulator
MCESCLSCPWREDSFFCQLEPDALKALNAITFANVYPAETLLFAEGETPRGLFILCYGAAQMSISSGGGKKLITRRVAQGEALGLAGVLSGNAHKATAETTAPSQLKFIRREDFVRFLGEYRDVLFNVSRQLIEEYEADADQIRALGLANSAAEKLAYLLLSWCDESGTKAESGVRVPVTMTHQEISQMIGTSRETVSRLLKSFKEKKIITMRRSSMTVHRRDELEDLILL